MKNNIFQAEARQLMTREFADTLARKQPAAYLRIHDPIQEALAEQAAVVQGERLSLFSSTCIAPGDPANQGNR